VPAMNSSENVGRTSSGVTAFNLVPMMPRHLRQVVDVHMRGFPNFFLTFLGPVFVREVYRSFLTDPAGSGFVAEDTGTGKVLGVVVGALTPAGYFKRLLKRRWWMFCLASTSAILKRPTVVRRLFRALFYRGDSPPGPQRSLLVSIVVAPEARGSGVGRALMEAWLADVRQQGSPGCFLATDAHDNETVNRFYQKAGWKLESTYQTPEGRAMNRYVSDFPSRARRSGRE